MTSTATGTATVHGSTEDRFEPRYFIGPKSSTAATLHYIHEGKETTVGGKLVDVSRGGVCLETRQRLEKDTRVIIVLQLPSIRGQLRMDAWVQWAQPHTSNRWLIGLRLEKSISDEAIDEMAKSSIINRRQDERWSLGQSVSLHVELRTDPVIAQVVNFSVGGFQIITTDDVSLEPGSRMVLKNDESESIPAKVVWTNQTGNCSVAGCSFLSSTGFTVFSELFPTSEAASRVNTFLRWRGIWLAILAILFVQVFGLLNLGGNAKAKDDLKNQADRQTQPSQPDTNSAAQNRSR